MLSTLMGLTISAPDHSRCPEPDAVVRTPDVCPYSLNNRQGAGYCVHAPPCLTSATQSHRPKPGRSCHSGTVCANLQHPLCSEVKSIACYDSTGVIDKPKAAQDIS
jgi:hypothetical protein